MPNQYAPNEFGVFIIQSCHTPGATCSKPQTAMSCPPDLHAALFAALSALLLSLSESNPARAALYFAICAPLALIFFSMASSSALALR